MYYCYSGSKENDTENLMAAFGEFALLDSEGMPVEYVMRNTIGLKLRYLSPFR